MKRKIIIIFYISSLLSAQNMTLTLEESIKIGLEKSKELAISRNQIEIASAARREISASRLPSISLNAKYAHLSDVPPFEVDLPILPSPITLQETYLNNYSLMATVEQPIFTGFKLSSMLSAAEYAENAENASFNGKRVETADKIFRSFWNLYIAEQILDMVDRNLENFNSHLKNTEIMLENGLVTKNDLLKLKVEVGNAELNLIDSKNKFMLAKASFNTTIGFPIDSETKISADSIVIVPLDLSLDRLIEEAVKSRSEIKATQLILNSLEDQESAQKSDWYPHLYAFGNFYYNNPHQRFLPLEDKFNESWDIGVALKWKIWEWGTTSAKAEKARHEYLRTENKLRLINENIQLDVYDKYLKLTESQKKIQLGEVQLVSAEENYRITEQKYYQQLATATDLIDAETSLFNAKINLLKAKVEYKIGLSALNRALGKF